MLWSLSKKIKKNIENSYGDIKEGRFDTLGKVKRELNLFSKYYELSLLGRLYMNQKFYLPRIFLLYRYFSKRRWKNEACHNGLEYNFIASTKFNFRSFL